MNIKQLKYDLAMQCALADILHERSNDIDFDTRKAMLEKFESYYHYYSQLDDSRWEPFRKLD